MQRPWYYSTALSCLSPVKDRRLWILDFPYFIQSTSVLLFSTPRKYGFSSMPYIHFVFQFSISGISLQQSVNVEANVIMLRAEIDVFYHIHLQYSKLLSQSPWREHWTEINKKCCYCWILTEGLSKSPSISWWAKRWTSKPPSLTWRWATQWYRPRFSLANDFKNSLAKLEAYTTRVIRCFNSYFQCRSNNHNYATEK